MPALLAREHGGDDEVGDADDDEDDADDQEHARDPSPRRPAASSARAARPACGTRARAAPARGRRRARRSGQPLEHARDRGVRLEPREVHPDADVRAVRRTPRAASRSRAARRSGRGRGTPPGRGWRPRSRRSRARARRSARRPARRRASRSGRRRRRPAPAAATPRSRWRAAPARRGRAASWSGCASRCAIALAIIPSVVSIPPNSITAALEIDLVALEPAGRRSRRRRAATSPARASQRGLHRGAQRLEAARAGLGRRAAGGDLRDRRDDRVVPGEHLGGPRRLAARARA